MSQLMTFLTVREAADLLRVSRNTVYGMASAGRLPGIRVGSQLRIPADELQDWMERNRWFENRQEQG